MALHRRIARDLERAARRSPVAGTAHGHAEAITHYGLRAPQLYDVIRRLRDEIAEPPLADRFALARLLLHSHVEEQGHVALAVLRGGLEEMQPKHFAVIDRLIDDFTSWSMTDDFASGKASITWYLLQRFPDETLALLERWNASSNRWKRRASVITFTRAAAATGDYVDVTLRFCTALRHDADDLVQKGIGWTLKDAMRTGPTAKRRVIALVKKMRRAGVRSTITLYAIRDLMGAERQAVLAVRPASPTSAKQSKRTT